jgi:ketosteroid isomerase-like protein
MKYFNLLPLTAIIVVSLFTVNLSAQKNQRDKQAVLQVMSQYKNAVESLNAKETPNLFSNDSQVFESGGVEGNYAHYLEHHLGPELNYFKSFKFNNYKAEVQIDLPYAFVTETYNYEIVVKANPQKERKERVITKKGVATSILKKTNEVWKIIKTHSSSRNILNH